MDSNPYQSPATATQPLPDPDAPRRSTAGTVLRIVCAIPLLLYGLGCIGSAFWTGYVWVTLDGDTGGSIWPIAILFNLLTGASLAAWAVGLLRRHRGLTWLGFLGLILCILLATAVFFLIVKL